MTRPMDRDIDEIRQQMLDMGGMVEEMVDQAIEALVTRDEGRDVRHPGAEEAVRAAEG